MVGAKGFEPSTLWSQTRCATRLRYAPTDSIVIAEAALFERHPLHQLASPIHDTAPAPLPWLARGDAFPPADTAWGVDTVAPGLLCAGADLSVRTLQNAYQNGIFPWFSADQPILWWSPAPRMVLEVDQFKLHPSLKKTLKKLAVIQTARFASTAHLHTSFRPALAVPDTARMAPGSCPT